MPTVESQEKSYQIKQKQSSDPKSKNTSTEFAKNYTKNPTIEESPNRNRIDGNSNRSNSIVNLNTNKKKRNETITNQKHIAIQILKQERENYGSGNRVATAIMLE